jgi:amidohydrolase
MTSPMDKTFKEEAAAMLDQLIAWRRDFHMHPEIGFQEVRTGGIVADHLHSLGLEVTQGVGKTGVVALVEPDNVQPHAPTVMLRFDMDALPIQEESEIAYRSRNAGTMHACGHDGHTAIGMGVASLLARHRNELCGRVKLVFQPAEEGLGGARAMIADGALDDPTPGAAFALHLWNQLPLNQVIVQEGPLWATTGRFHLTVHGRGGHGAEPHTTVDATLIAAQILVSWQSIVARNVRPIDSAVITVGAFHSGSAANVISEKAVLDGTYRAFRRDVERLLLERMEVMAKQIAAAYGGSAEFSSHLVTEATVNDAAGAALMQDVAAAVVGPEDVIQIEPMMVGEDMAEFLNCVGGCFVLVGAADPDKPLPAPHHNPRFDFDERMLPTGVALLASAAYEYLKRLPEGRTT